MGRRAIESWVGFFIVVGAIALAFLAFKVSGLTSLTSRDSYTVSADFSNIGGLKVRAPVLIGGVSIGDVKSITLNSDYLAEVTMAIHKGIAIPVDSSAKILTAGLLGSQYVGVEPGEAPVNIAENGQIKNTSSALVLEDLISKFIGNGGGSKK